MDPNQQHNNQQNGNSAPPPGMYQPQPHDQLAENQQQTPQPHLMADEQIAKKRKQAKMFTVVAIVLSLLFIIGIIFVAFTFRSGDDIDPADLTLDEQLKSDANSLGLAIINYNSGREPFEITPNAAAELKVAYLPSEFNDPRTNEPYTLVTSIPEVGEMQYIIGGVCNNDDSVSQGTDPDGFAVRVRLDTDSTLYCIEKSEVKQATKPTP